MSIRASRKPVVPYSKQCQDDSLSGSEISLPVAAWVARQDSNRLGVGSSSECGASLRHALPCDGIDNG
jgi:hypothetical protein